MPATTPSPMPVRRGGQLHCLHRPLPPALSSQRPSLVQAAAGDRSAAVRRRVRCRLGRRHGPGLHDKPRHQDHRL